MPAAPHRRLMEAPAATTGMAWGETGGYVVFHHDGDRVGGLMPMPATVPAGAPSHWMVYFAVDDAPATSELAAASGGTVLVPVRDIDEGRFAVLEDPTGAVFAVFEGTP